MGWGVIAGLGLGCLVLGQEAAAIRTPAKVAACSSFRIQYVLYVLRICLSIFIITDQCPLVDDVSFLYNVARMSTDSSMGKSLGARIPTYSVMGKYLGYSAHHIPVQ